MGQPAEKIIVVTGGVVIAALPDWAFWIRDMAAGCGEDDVQRFGLEIREHLMMRPVPGDRFGNIRTH